MPDTTWTLHVELDGTIEAIVATALEGATPRVTHGAEIETELLFDDRDQVAQSASERYRSLWPLLDVNQEAALRYGTGATGVPWFRERYPDTMPPDSLLVGVEPGEDAVDTRGWWGLLIGYADESLPFEADGATRRIALTWVVLARYSDFGSHDAVRTALSEGVV